jgi:hypothetical protein
VTSEVEASILARLADRLPPEVRVLSTLDLVGLTEGSQPTPAVHVVYRGYRVLEDQQQGRLVRLEPRWWVVAAVRSVREVRGGRGALLDGLAVEQLVRSHLMGWTPAGASTPLRLQDSPELGFAGGYGYFPQSFVTQVLEAAA